MSGYASDAAETFRVTVSTLSGDPVEVACTRDVGKELLRLLDAAYATPGCQNMPRVLIDDKAMESDQHLIEQGLKDGDALTIVKEEITETMRKDAADNVNNRREFMHQDLHVWHSVQASSKLVKLFFEQNMSLPVGLQRLTFGSDFNQHLDNMTLPAGLQRLTFGRNFNQPIDNVTLSAELQSLTFGSNFDQSMDNVTLPAGLQSVAFDSGFKQSQE